MGDAPNFGNRHGAGAWGVRLPAVILLAITRHTGIRLAELGFLLVAIGGALLVIGQSARGRGRTGTGLAGVALGLGGVLLIVATHWGHFG